MMTIPRHDEIQPEALKTLGDGTPRRAVDLEEPLAAHFGLTEEELARLYDSGNGPVFYDRIGWALSYLSMAGLVDKPKRGVYQINETGQKLLEKIDQLPEYVRRVLAERDLQKKLEKQTEISETENGAEDVSDLTPQEQLYNSFETIRQSVYDDILDTILGKTPREFEKLVVNLLERMGYGGRVENAGEVTRYVNDGGIDGVIKEDVLGLGRVHIQAKRYARENSVGREEVQKFVGALAGAQSMKGVFITTSRYSPGAVEYAKSVHGNTTVVLIDGPALAEHIYKYGLGMQVEQTIEIKKLDADFWDKMQDE